VKAARAPAFWWQPPSLVSRLLTPASFTYGRVARRNLVHGPRSPVDCPVLCVGNFTVGGGGKTPTAIALGHAALSLGRRPGFVSRGYGRKSRKPLIVDPARHGVADVGDEPLLLARVAPTAVAADRAVAAELLIRERGVDFVIMDDGFQSAHLAIDYALIALDARRGLGNGAVFPAGPLRAPLIDQIRHADGLLLIGSDEEDNRNGEVAVRMMARAGRPIFSGSLMPKSRHILFGERILAFAGIADPTKFYASLRDLGCDVVETRDFPDHHPFVPDDLAALAERARTEKLVLATTRKDAVRIAGVEDGEIFLKGCAVLDVELEFAVPTVPRRIVRETIAALERRRAHLVPAHPAEG